MLKTGYRKKAGEKVKLTIALEPVADVTYRFNEGVGLAYETPDVDIHCSVAAEVIIASDLVEEGIPGEYSALVAGKESEQLVFFESELNKPFIEGDLTTGQIYH